ncbi:MAG TPA: N-acetylmuramoyl-L-alanine amidase [Candidatus Moranbacteria bacterium]|nr:N-acetylmuramoyl-L-alanine amidase [Candidatus Moranbacteria bacterium]HRZ33865.1 N-acetylmuramoyl-L-alanine amidase [Candidatus Moranbacteria bacterium]
MRKITCSLLLSLMVLFAYANPVLASNELAGMVVVIDPGHGGQDPGALGFFNKDGKKHRITESAYCYDVALRLEKILKKKGALVIKTTRNGSWSSPIANKPNEVIRENGRAVFTWDNTLVKAGPNGLYHRVAVANNALRKFGMRRVVFISVHFDVLGQKTLESARIITGKSANDLSSLLEDELENERRVSNIGKPVVKNGDKAHGIKRIYVLGDTNRIKQKVLIELGNFKNEKDLWRIRDYKVRENYAQIVVRALIRLNAQPIRR